MKTLEIQIPIVGELAEGVLVTDHKGVIHYVNPQFESMFGYTCGDLCGRHVSVLNACDQGGDRLEEIVKEIDRSGSWKGEFENIRKDGTRFTSRSSITRTEAAGKKWFISVQQDVTRQKEAERALRESENRFRTLCDSAPIGIFLSDSEGRNIYTNRYWLDLTGLTFEEALGTGWSKAICPQDLEAVTEAWEEGVPQLPLTQTLRLISAEGKRVWVQSTVTPINTPDGAITGLVGVVENIDERKRATDLIRESEDRLNLALAASQMGVWEWNIQTDEALWSSECSRIMGLEQPAGGLSWFISLLHDEDRERVRTLVEESLENRTVFCAEFRLPRPDGSNRWLSNLGRFYYDESGRAVRLVGTVQDCTERHCMMEELIRSRHELEMRVAERTTELARTVDTLRGEIAERKRVEEILKEESLSRVRTMEELYRKDELLLHQSRQAALGEMIGNIAHQWRQPLNNIALLVQDLKISSDSAAITKTHIDAVVDRTMETIQHMSRTIDDFRYFFRPEKEKVDFDLDLVVKKTISLATAGIKSHRIAMSYEKAGTSTYIKGYPNEFSQAIINILNNARDALVERGVEIPTISVRVTEEKGKAVVTIADNAGGIRHDILDRIFEPYFTTKGPDQGTGIGLYMAKTIIEKNMGGILSVRNTVSGAEFRLEL